MYLFTSLNAATILWLASFTVNTLANPLEKRQLGTATVSLAAPSGTPAHLAAGFIYGIPDNGSSISTQIPDHFYTDIKFNYCRAGGAQLPAPARGWVQGIVEFDNRFLSALSNYRTTRKFGARYVLLVHDLWGADSLQSSSTVYPGDNNDWANFDAFLTRLIAALKANNVIDGLDLDIWNEPDIQGFWTRSPEQWVQMWGRAYYRFRRELPGALISGPSMAAPPVIGNRWWDTYGAFLRSNNSIPDVYTWHNLGRDRELATTLPRFRAWLQQYALPARPMNVNEYANPDEQIPSIGAWYIAQFERFNVRGLRANWASAYELHDYMGNLLGKPNAGTPQYVPSGSGYWPVGEWQVYKYYGTDMTGQRVATTGSSDNLFEVYATRGSTANSVKILAATRGTTGLYDITVTGLSAVGITSGSVTIRTKRFDNNGKYGPVGPPVDLGIYSHQIANGQITFWVQPATPDTAYAFEFV